ncbi:hypothetical protein SUDANB176_00277 [Streptomyces sp. enrichment culture]
MSASGAVALLVPWRETRRRSHRGSAFACGPAPAQTPAVARGPGARTALLRWCGPARARVSAESDQPGRTRGIAHPPHKLSPLEPDAVVEVARHHAFGPVASGPATRPAPVTRVGSSRAARRLRFTRSIHPCPWTPPVAAFHGRHRRIGPPAGTTQGSSSRVTSRVQRDLAALPTPPPDDHLRIPRRDAPLLPCPGSGHRRRRPARRELSTEPEPDPTAPDTPSGTRALHNMTAPPPDPRLRHVCPSPGWLRQGFRVLTSCEHPTTSGPSRPWRPSSARAKSIRYRGS